MLDSWLRCTEVKVVGSPEAHSWKKKLSGLDVMFSVNLINLNFY